MPKKHFRPMKAEKNVFKKKNTSVLDSYITT